MAAKIARTAAPIMAALILGLLIGQTCSPAERVKAAPEAVHVVSALEAAWALTWEGATPPAPTSGDGDQRACWRVEAFDYDYGDQRLECWRCIDRAGEPIWAWYPPD